MDKPVTTSSMSLLLPLHTLSSSSSAPSPQPIIRSSKLLEERSVTIINALEDGSRENAGYGYLAPNHVCEMPGDGRAQYALTMRSRDEFVALRAGFKAMNPGIRISIVRATSRVRESCGWATVYVTCHLAGYSSRDMKARESVAQLEWRYIRSVGWTCVGSVFLHGHAY